jgi:N-acetyl-anhydromuramyl-L-alanine amidase AmpD
VIEGDGSIKRGRDLHEIGAHAKGANADSIGICVVGDNTKKGEQWSHAQEDSLLTYIDALEFLIPDIEVVGHRDVGTTKTECPGLDIADWLKRTL